MKKRGFEIQVNYEKLLDMRRNLQKKYANGIMTRKDYETQMHQIDKVIADAEKGRRTGKVI